MSNEKGWREPKRARRIRDRLRMRKRGSANARHTYGMAYPIDHLGGEGHLGWIDLSGQTRHGVCTWDDVMERRRIHGTFNGDNLAVCSCYMCGNPRRFFGDATMQENRARANGDEQMRENGFHPSRGS